MENILTCYGDVVGLAHGGDSDSGIFITDLEAVSTIEGLVVEQGMTVEQILEEARRVAILALNADLTAMLTKYSNVRRPITSKIGSSRWTTKARGGAELVVLCRPLPNATLNIRRIGAIFQHAGDREVRLRSNTGADQTFTITSEADRLSSIEVDLSLPMYSDMVDVVEYRFSHEEDYCDARLQRCGSCRFRFSYQRPRFTSQGLTSYVLAAGYKNGVYQNSSAGLVLATHLECRIDNVFCDDGLDYIHDPVAQMIAQAVQYKAGSVVVWNCLRNPNLNRVLMENSDDLREAAKYYERRYRDMILFINKHNVVSHDCVCEKRSSWISQIR